MRRLVFWYSLLIMHAVFLGYCVGVGWPYLAPLVVQGFLGWGGWRALEDFRRETVDNVLVTWYDVPSDSDSPDQTEDKG